jgi:hypothetical protein
MDATHRPPSISRAAGGADQPFYTGAATALQGATSSARSELAFLSRDLVAFYFVLGVSGQVDAPIVCCFQLQRIHNQPKKPYQNHQTILLKTAAFSILCCPYSKPFSSRLGNLAIAVLKEI